MDFIDSLKQFSKRVDKLKDNLQTEEATKTSLIMPFFQLLGYDVFNPDEFTPEYTADVGIKKGEKVDYAILKDGEPIILVEAKWVGAELTKHDSQLFRYFSTTRAKFAILTNGIIYRFYTDLDEQNKMDETPFFEINILDIKEAEVNELKKFQKNNFDMNTISNVASELKYSSEFKKILSNELDNPTDDFIRLLLNDIYSGIKTQNVIEKFRPIVKKSLNQFITDMLNDKIKSALSNNNSEKSEIDNEVAATLSEDNEDEDNDNTIVTTEEELESFYIVKTILRENIDTSKLVYKDTASYFGILFENNVRKWICRFKLTPNVKVLMLPSDNGIEKINLESLDNLYDNENKNKIIESAKRFI